MIDENTRRDAQYCMNKYDEKRSDEFDKNMIGNYGKRMNFENLHAIMSLGGRMMCRS